MTPNCCAFLLAFLFVFCVVEITSAKIIGNLHRNDTGGLQQPPFGVPESGKPATAAVDELEALKQKVGQLESALAKMNISQNAAADKAMPLLIGGRGWKIDGLTATKTSAEWSSVRGKKPMSLDGMYYEVRILNLKFRSRFQIGITENLFGDNTTDTIVWEFLNGFYKIKGGGVLGFGAQVPSSFPSSPIFFLTVNGQPWGSPMMGQNVGNEVHPYFATDDPELIVEFNFGTNPFLYLMGAASDV